MSTTPVPDPTQKRIEALEAEVAALQAAKAARAPFPLWAKFSAWFASKHWTFHTLWIGYLAVSGVVATNAQAHAAFLDLWAHVPHWMVSVAAIAGPSIALLVSGNKSPQAG